MPCQPFIFIFLLSFFRPLYCDGQNSGVIVDNDLVHIRQAGNSVAMETVGLRRILQRLENEITVTQLMTDRSLQVIDFHRP